MTGYLFVLPKEGVLVGNGGFVGPPDAAGFVEIGYKIAPSFLNRGLATAAVVAMVQYAFSYNEVQAVFAHLGGEERIQCRFEEGGHAVYRRTPQSENWACLALA